MLRSFARHVGEDKVAKGISLDTCVSFLYGKECRVTQSWFLRYSALKWMFGWAVVRGYMDEIPLPEEQPRRLEHMTPYIYSKAELKLGHVSVETTNIYAEVNLEMKAKALLNCEMKAKKSKKHWRDDKNLMAFLDSL